jgi:hypothetical protein
MQYLCRSNKMEMKRILYLLYRDLAIAVMQIYTSKILCGTCVCAYIAKNMSTVCNVEVESNSGIYQRRRNYCQAKYVGQTGRNFRTFFMEHIHTIRVSKKKKKLHGLSPRANYTDRATAACRRSDCQILRIESATWPA